MTALDHAVKLSVEQDFAAKYAADLCVEFEGFHADPYFDPVYYPTRGYGELLESRRYPEARDNPVLSDKILSRWASVTHPEAIAGLEEKLRRFQLSVLRLIRVALTDAQEGALIDFAYNLGAGALQSSTLRRVINRGDFDAAPAQFMRWVRAGGRVWPGLVRRRRAEADLWTSGKLP